jgi:hypothetical protein
MPVASITLLAGYGPETEARLVRRVALATRSVIAAPASGTTVFVKHAATYMRDGRVFTGGGPALPEAADVVRAFLQSMQKRELAAARGHLAIGFEMVFPGGARMTRLEELLEWASGRYRSIAKNYERFDESWQDGVTVVFCSGTLQGAWPDGTTFEGIRFVDRFELVDGKIRRQEVWNDLAEARRA